MCEDIQFSFWYKTMVVFQCGSTTYTHMSKTPWRWHDLTFIQNNLRYKYIFIICMLQKSFPRWFWWWAGWRDQPQWRINIQPATTLAKITKPTEKNTGAGLEWMGGASGLWEELWLKRQLWTRRQTVTVAYQDAGFFFFFFLQRKH